MILHKLCSCHDRLQSVLGNYIQGELKKSLPKSMTWSEKRAEGEGSVNRRVPKRGRGERGCDLHTEGKGRGCDEDELGSIRPLIRGRGESHCAEAVKPKETMEEREEGRIAAIGNKRERGLEWRREEAFRAFWHIPHAAGSFSRKSFHVERGASTGVYVALLLCDVPCKWPRRGRR